MPLDLAASPIKPLTWRDVLVRLPDDPAYPSDRRAFDASRVAKALAWDAAPPHAKAKSKLRQPSKFIDRLFNHDTIDELFDVLRPAELRLAPKTLENARSICKFVADHYEVARSIGHTPPSPDCKRLLGLVTNRWDRRALWPAGRFFSYYNINPWDTTQAHIDELEKPLAGEFKLADARPAYNEFTRVWNKGVGTIPDWPRLIIARNIAPRLSVFDWIEHAALKTAIEKYIARGRILIDLTRTDEVDRIEGDENEELDEDDDVVVPFCRRPRSGIATR